MKMYNSAWSDSCGTKIVLTCKQILQFKHRKRKDEKKYQQGTNLCSLGIIHC